MSQKNGANGTARISCIGRRTEAATLRRGRYQTSLLRSYASGNGKSGEKAMKHAFNIHYILYYLVYNLVTLVSFYIIVYNREMMELSQELS